MHLAKRYIVTSALPYANGPLHIGHLTGAYLPADIYVRFLRLMDKDVVWVCGSDEHGAAITIRARQENLTPTDIIDTYHQKFVEAFQGMNISFDTYHRTSSPIHHETSQEIFRHLEKAGEFEKKTQKQYYDPVAEQFLADRYIKGECPNCGKEAYGDQCEGCGKSLSPTDLIHPVSTLSDAEPILKETTHWYLPLQNYESWLKEYILEGKLDGKEHHDPKLWKNHVLGQCRSWIEGGLEARAMTRDLEWGVDVPSELEGSEGKKLYVWMDAPIGYISATKQWAQDHDKDWKSYWQEDDSCLIHFIGKDNIVFHCLIFPAILKAHGNYVLPHNVPANQFLNLEGEKLSTSKNWAIWVNDYLERWPGQSDELRHYLIKNMPEQRDSDFQWKAMQEAVNTDLVNNVGNFINRVLVLTHKYYEGEIPAFDENLDILSPRHEDEYAYHDSELLFLFDLMDEYCEHLRRFNFREAQKTMLSVSSYGNQLLQFNAPWKLIKEDEEKTKVVMNLAAQFVHALSLMMRPFTPEASERLRQMMNLEALRDSGELLDALNGLAEGEPLLSAGHQLGKSAHLFSRIEDESIEKELALLQEKSNTKEESAPVKEAIEFNDFMKIDLRTGTILSAERIPKTDKLMKLEVDMGFERRTIVSGIAEHFEEPSLPGQEVVVVANLAPKKMRGVESNGMILMAEDQNGRLSFVRPDQGLGNGMIVK